MIETIVTHFIVFLIGLLFGTLSVALCMAQKYDKTRSEIDEDNNNISES